MKTITITAMARPELFAQMLDSLLSADPSGWHVYVAIEPSPHQAEIAEIAAAKLPAEELTIIRNATRLGIRQNPLSAIERAFADGSAFNLCLEEDFILAPDALVLADWYIANAQPHWMGLNLLAATCGSRGNMSYPDLPKLLFESRGFSSIGVGFSADNWATVGPIWRAPSQAHRRRYKQYFKVGWDHELLHHLLTHPALRMVHPVAARCTHAGPDGTHCTPDFQDEAFGHIALCDRTTASARQDGFTLTPINALPPRVAGHAYAQQDIADRQADLFAVANILHQQPRSTYERLSDLNYRLRQRRRNNRTS